MGVAISVLSKLSLTQYISRHRDRDGRYSLIHSPVYSLDGLEYQLNHDPDDKNSNPIRKEIIDKFITQLRAMQSHYREVYGFRFDLSVPEGMSAEESNKLISELFARLRGEFTAKAWSNQPIRKFAYGWVREKEKAKQVHYHCWIALPYFQVRTAGFGDDGMIGRISRIWTDLTNGVSRVHLPHGRYIIRQCDHASLVEMVKRISYLAKNRGKSSDQKGQPKMFSGSRLQMKAS
ncbi:MAG: hypothetical protein DI535_28695 [Citrobacter freundii]|nr:inovirus-type Gp2 protein [Citrobacter freundii]PZR21200.1 MAG: hypothetical protein DI535_28695 [Citrobacter freundii]HCE8850405.1 inovirus-type Gp2 protein [Citrobacter freundii]HCL6630963.1 inovirus-type Gp2 protein [Citrobacter freundii]HCL6761621.1 inovirus-type Gp2 protein [Citrobacter freundii]